MKRLRNRLTPILATLLLACSCSYNPDSYNCFSDIDPTEGWRYGSTFVYMPDVAHDMVDGTLALFVRHTNDYPYSNLWVEVESQQPADSGHITVLRDTFCITLADVYGNWLGRGNGTTIEKIDTLYSDYTLIDGAPLRLRHVMRPDCVTALEKVGLMFEPFENVKR